MKLFNSNYNNIYQQVQDNKDDIENLKGKQFKLYTCSINLGQGEQVIVERRLTNLPKAEIENGLLLDPQGNAHRVLEYIEDTDSFVVSFVLNVKGQQGEPGTSITACEIIDISETSIQFKFIKSDGTYFVSETLNLPRGPQGEQGPKGRDGDTFDDFTVNQDPDEPENATIIFDYNHEGEQQQFRSQITLPKGPQGPQGEPGVIDVNSLHAILEGSATVTADLNETGDKVVVKLDEQYREGLETDIADKLDKVTTQTDEQQVYVKDTNGEQIMVNKSEFGGGGGEDTRITTLTSGSYNYNNLNAGIYYVPIDTSVSIQFTGSSGKANTWTNSTSVQIGKGTILTVEKSGYVVYITCIVSSFSNMGGNGLVRIYCNDHNPKVTFIGDDSLYLENNSYIKIGGKVLNHFLHEVEISTDYEVIKVRYISTRSVSGLTNLTSLVNSYINVCEFSIDKETGPIPISITCYSNRTTSTTYYVCSKISATADGNIKIYNSSGGEIFSVNFTAISSTTTLI